MRLGGYRTSDNVRDQGQGGGGFGFGGGGGGGGGCLFALLPMVLSRFGIGGVLILLLGYCALSYMGGGGGLGLGGSGTTVAPAAGDRRHERREAGLLHRARQALLLPGAGQHRGHLGQAVRRQGAALSARRLLASTAAAAIRAAARPSPRWGPSTARPTTASISTPASSRRCRRSSAPRAISPRPMSSPTRSATTSRI